MQGFMNHLANPAFWSCLRKLPKNIQQLAGKNFDLLKENPNHASLHLKRIRKYWSVRIGIKHRALAYEIDKNLVWFWIGTHAQYDKLLKDKK